jgi:hypothetical protein
LEDIEWINVTSNNNSEEATTTGILFGADHSCELEKLCPDSVMYVYSPFNIIIKNWIVTFDETETEINLGNSSLIYIKSSNTESVVNIVGLNVNFSKTVIDIPDNGGTIHFEGELSSIEILNSNFNNSVAYSKGGTFFFNISNEVDIYITSCNFSEGSAVFGGAIYTNVIFTLSYSEFINNIADDDKGRDIYYVKEEDVDFKSSNVIDSCSYPHKTDNVGVWIPSFVSNSTDVIYQNFLYYSCIVSGYIIAAPPQGINDALCILSNPCSLLETVFIREGVENDCAALSVGILSTFFTLTSSNVENRRLLIYPVTNSILSTTVNGKSDYALEVCKGSLRLKALKINYGKTENGKVFIKLSDVGDVRLIECDIIHTPPACTAPFVHVTATGFATVLIQSTNFISISLYNTSIIKLDKGGEVKVENSKIEKISINPETEYPVFISALSGDAMVIIIVKNTEFNEITGYGSGTVQGGVIGVNSGWNVSSSDSFVIVESVSVLNSNVSNTVGGFLYVNNLDRLDVSGNTNTESFTSVFQNITESTRGGAIYVQRAKAHISYVQFNLIRTETNGGAIYFGTDSEFHISNRSKNNTILKILFKKCIIFQKHVKKTHKFQIFKRFFCNDFLKTHHKNTSKNLLINV